MLLSKKNGSGLGNFQKQTCTAKTAEKEIAQGPRAVGKKCSSTRSCCVLKNTSYLKVMLQKIAICQKLNGTSVTE